MNPGDWPLICLKAQGKYFTNFNLPFGFRWDAACCQDITTLDVQALKKEGITTLAYIDDCWECPRVEALHVSVGYTAGPRLARNGAQSNPQSATTMVWLGLGLVFYTWQMTEAIPLAKLQETLQLAEEWVDRASANVHQL